MTWSSSPITRHDRAAVIDDVGDRLIAGVRGHPRHQAIDDDQLGYRFDRPHPVMISAELPQPTVISREVGTSAWYAMRGRPLGRGQ